VTTDRSTLEGKDRAELTVIATAMGNKVGSRMRKGQIIDLIIGSSDDGPEESEEEVVVADAADDSSNDAPESDDADAADGADSDDDVDSDADSGDGADDSDEEAADDAARSDDSNDSERKPRQNERKRNDAKKDGGRGDGGNKSNKNDGKHDSGQNDPEPGNKRRRRRRGRDRDELPWEGEPVSVDGFLDLRSDGYGFLRVEGGIPSRDDCYVPVKMVRDFGLRSGDRIVGSSRPAARNEKNPALLTIETVNDRDPEEARNRPSFDDLTPIFPDEQLVLERATTPANLTARIMDVVSPIGKGQRGLIVAPPKAGKTTVIKEIIRSIETNNPEVRLIVLLVDERPEEVTDMKRWMKNGEVVASTFDRPTDEHITVAELVGERARRMVESGDDVCIIMDSVGARCPAVSTPVRSTPPSACLVRLAMSKRVDRSRSWRRHLSRPARVWTRSSSKSSRAPATWSCASTAALPKSACSLPSTSPQVRPVTTSCCSTARAMGRPTRCVESSTPLATTVSQRRLAPLSCCSTALPARASARSAGLCVVLRRDAASAAEAVGRPECRAALATRFADVHRMFLQLVDLPLSLHRAMQRHEEEAPEALVHAFSGLAHQKRHPKRHQSYDCEYPDELRKRHSYNCSERSAAG